MKKAVLFCTLGVVCWILAAFLIVRFVRVLREEVNSNVVMVEAGHSVVFSAEGAGQYTLWHNYRDVVEGKTFHSAPELSSGFTFELRGLPSGNLVPLVTSHADTRYSSSQVSKKGLGTFVIPISGDYELTAIAPAGESRMFSLSRGSFMSVFGKLFGMMGAGVFLFIIGGLFLIFGIVMFIVGSNSKAQPPLSIDVT